MFSIDGKIRRLLASTYYRTKVVTLKQLTQDSAEQDVDTLN